MRDLRWHGASHIVLSGLRRSPARTTPSQRGHGNRARKNSPYRVCVVVVRAPNLWRELHSLSQGPGYNQAQQSGPSAFALRSHQQVHPKPARTMPRPARNATDTGSDRETSAWRRTVRGRPRPARSRRSGRIDTLPVHQQQIVVEAVAADCTVQAERPLCRPMCPKVRHLRIWRRPILRAR